MKKLFALILVLCVSIAVGTALAEEEEDFGSYLDDYPEAAAYNSAWVAEDGDWRIESYCEDDGVRVAIVHRLGDNKEDWWEYAAALNQARDALVTVPLGIHYQLDTHTGEWNTTYYEDGDAELVINDAGKLVWKDLKEDAGKGLEFTRIGLFYGSRWMKDDIEVIFFDWYDDCYDIRLYQRGENGEILKDAIVKGDYDAESDTVTGIAEFEEEEPFTVTFGTNENNEMVWIQDGETTVMDYSYYTD